MDVLQIRSCAVGGNTEGEFLYEKLDVAARNLAGHKLPTAYPSRRAWLHVQVRDEVGALVFESGARTTRGRRTGSSATTRPMRPIRRSCWRPPRRT